MMFKGALPPTISIAIYQSNGVAQTYSTLGYLVAIMSLLSFGIMPRAKFVQTMVFNIIGICIGASIALLSIYCSVQARAHTTPAQPDGPKSASGGPSPGAAVVPYNSSASAVCAIWLFFNIYLANALRAARPQFQFPVIVYSIFTNVASTYAPQFGTMAQGIAFTKRLLEAFLTGFAIAIGVSFCVFPITSRTIVFKTAAGYIGALRGALKAQSAYLQSLEDKQNFSQPAKAEKNDSSSLSDGDTPESKSQLSPKVKNLKAALAGLGEIHGKLNGEIPFAKREIAFGKLDASEISELGRLMRLIMLPVIGMGSVADIFDRVAERRGWRTAGEDDIKDQEKSRWSEIMRTLHEPFDILTQAIGEGLQHTLFTLELEKRPKNTKTNKTNQKVNQTTPDSADIEAKGDMVEPGTPKFAGTLSKRIDDFYEQRRQTLDAWCKQRGLDIRHDRLKNDPHPSSEGEHVSFDHSSQQRQLYLILYMEFLLCSTAQAVLALVQFADAKTDEGRLAKSRIIVPGMKRIKKWIRSAVGVEDSSTEHTPDSTEAAGANVRIGEAYQETRDPEHLPPKSAWQKFGNGIRGVGHMLDSQESAFGFRVACATLSIGIVAYLRDTQQFFSQQRLVWAMIMVAIGMTMTAGAGVFGFIGRIAGTAIAMCTSFLIWYIVDGKTAGVIVLIFVFTFCEFYFVLKYPRFIVIALISMVTQVLIVGYELQVRKVGEKVATSNGQPAYPIYELAPYRLACVAGGMLVAFIWTFFPYPLTARSQLRKDLGASLYVLASFYSCVHTTVHMRLTGSEGDMDVKTSPGRMLEKARHKLFTQELALLAGLRQHSAFTAWEPSFGGKFPRQQYDTIIQGVQNILDYMSLISYASNLLSGRDKDDPTSAGWLKDFTRLISSISVTSEETTSTLVLLSASITNGNALPPYMKAPAPYKLSATLEAIDPDILSTSHIAEPGYAAFAVMQIASAMINDDMEKLISNVRALVGEVDFSFHQDSANDSEKGKKD